MLRAPAQDPVWSGYLVCPGEMKEEFKESHSESKNRATTIIDWSPDTPLPLGTDLLPTPEVTPDSLPLT